ncbi:MAG: SPOR domain-containing protein [Legionella sp.]
MAKDYGKKQVVMRRHYKKSNSKPLLLIAVSFLCGYLVSTVIDFNAIANWLQTNVFVQRQGTDTVNAAKVAAQTQVAKPKFEFYTLLTNEHRSVPSSRNSDVNKPEPSTIDTVSPTTMPVSKAQVMVSQPATTVSIKTRTSPIAMKPVANNESYLVQIASFKNRKDAEHMRATLILKGFTVNIAVISQQQVNWYRVIIGPFSSRALAEKAQASIAHSEHMMGMVRKIG